MEETIRITQSEYDRCIENNKEINRLTDEGKSSTEKFQFVDRGMFPTVKQMEKMKVRENVRKYWKFLMFYHIDGLFECNDPEYARTREYIQDIFDNQVMVIPDEVMEPIRSLQKGQWARMDLDAKKFLFRPLIEYYGVNEVDSMIRDVGYQKYMQHYGVTEQIYNEGRSEKLTSVESDLVNIWTLIWACPDFMRVG